nr:hypothetical protein [Tanacetum cinerariifolium]
RRHIDRESHQMDLQLEVRRERYSRSKLLFKNLQILFKVDFDQGFEGLRLSSFTIVLGFVKHRGSKQVGLRQLGSKQVGFKQLGHKQVGFKQLGTVFETGFHGVQDKNRVWFKVELHGAQGDRKAEVFQVSNDDTAVAQRRLEDNQPEEKRNMDCLAKE